MQSLQLSKWPGLAGCSSHCRSVCQYHIVTPNLMWMDFKSSHRYVGRSAEHTRTAAACLFAFMIMRVGVLHRPTSKSMGGLQSGGLKVTSVVQQDQHNSHISTTAIPSIGRELRHSLVGEKLHWMCQRKYWGTATAQPLEYKRR